MPAESTRFFELDKQLYPLVNQFYMAAMAMGWEDLGTQGLFKVLSAMSHDGSIR